jgi:hypothetical protein
MIKKLNCMACSTDNEPELNEEVACVYGTCKRDTEKQFLSNLQLDLIFKLGK